MRTWRIFNRTGNSQYSRCGLGVREHLQTLKTAKTFRRAETRTNEHFASSDGVSKAIRASSCAFSIASGTPRWKFCANVSEYEPGPRAAYEINWSSPSGTAAMEISKKMPLSRTLVSWCNFVPFVFSKKDYDRAVPVLLSVFEMLPFFKLCHVYLFISRFFKKDFFEEDPS